MELKDQIKDKLEKGLADIVAAVTAKGVTPETPAPTPVAQPQMDPTALATAVGDVISKALEPIIADINVLKEAKPPAAPVAATTEKTEQPITPEDAQKKVMATVAAMAKELGLDPENFTVTVKETKKGTVGDDNEQELHKAKQDGDDTATGETLDEQLAKATPEERKGALGMFVRNAMGIGASAR